MGTADGFQTNVELGLPLAVHHVEAGEGFQKMRKCRLNCKQPPTWNLDTKPRAGV